MAVAVTMAQMKIAVLRHAYRGQRGQTAGTGAAIGVLLAAGTVYLAFLGPDLLAAGLAVWLLGWTLGPVFMGGGDETLRPEYFTLLGLPPRRLAVGLLAGAFVGVAPLVSLCALIGLAVYGARLGVVNALVALPAMALTLAAFVLMSKVAVGLVGLALRTRAGALGAGLVNGAILASLGQVWVFMVAFGQTGTPAAVWYLPSAWGVLAVQGKWWALAAQAALCLILLAAWAGLLSLRAGAPRVSGRGRRGPITAGTASGAVVAKELRTWARDLVRNHYLAFALAYGLTFAASPLLIGWNGMLPYAGPIFVVMAAGMSSNLYGSDGTALWLTMMAGASDVRGRQLAWLSTQGVVAVVLTVACTAVTGGPWPLVLALLAALLGGAAGLVPLVSVYALVPSTDPHRRGGNPLRTSEDEGGLTGLAYLMFALMLLTGAPAGLVAIWFGWAGVAVGVATGVLCWWGFGRLAERRLASHGPELLDTMRTGHKPKASPAGMSFQGLSRTKRSLAGWCFGLGAIPLVPQGIIAAVFIANGKLHNSWFLATYMPEGWRYPVAFAFIALGAGMYGTALWISAAAKKEAASS